MMFLERKRNDAGRTILEMLGVLAIIGIITIIAFWGYKYAINKMQANKIISDGQFVYLNATEAEGKAKNQWFVYDQQTESQKTFSYMLDVGNKPYVKVQGVDEAICNLILDMKNERLNFYTDENVEFTTCEADNMIIIDYAGTGLPKECTSYSDCGDGGSTFCSESGQCKTCEDGRLRNEDGTACLCLNSELTCQDKDGNSWCCGENEEFEETICGSTKGECTPSKGECSYQVSAQTQTRAANCSYTVSSAGEVTPSQECTGENEYCYLSYAKQDCSSTAGADITGTIYGTCILQTSNNGSYCNLYSETDAVTPLVDCPANKYCYLNWASENCSANADAGLTGTIYGTCIPQITNSPECPY